LRISQEETADRQTVLNVVLEDEDLEPYLNRGYRKVVQHAMIPGFRRGKAPRSIVERYLGRESLLNEVIDYMLPDATERAIEAEKLEFSGTPKIELLEMEPVTVKVTVALTPLVDLGAYRDIRLDDEPMEVTQDDVEGRLQGLLVKSAAWDPVDRPVNMGDMVTMNVVGTVENSTILDDKDAVYVLEEENLRPFPGFSQQLEGAQESVSKEFELKISDDHADARLAGKEALFRVTVAR
jgi:trigger factor